MSAFSLRALGQTASALVLSGTFAAGVPALAQVSPLAGVSLGPPEHLEAVGHPNVAGPFCHWLEKSNAEIAVRREIADAAWNAMQWDHLAYDLRQTLRELEGRRGGDPAQAATNAGAIVQLKAAIARAEARVAEAEQQQVGLKQSLEALMKTPVKSCGVPSATDMSGGISSTGMAAGGMPNDAAPEQPRDARLEPIRTGPAQPDEETVEPPPLPPIQDTSPSGSYDEAVPVFSSAQPSERATDAPAGGYLAALTGALAAKPQGPSEAGPAPYGTVAGRTGFDGSEAERRLQASEEDARTTLAYGRFAPFVSRRDDRLAAVPPPEAPRGVAAGANVEDARARLAYGRLAPFISAGGERDPVGRAAEPLSGAGPRTGPTITLYTGPQAPAQLPPAGRPYMPANPQPAAPNERDPRLGSGQVHSSTSSPSPVASAPSAAMAPP